MKNISFIILISLLASCSKPEGEGGNSSISGKVNLEFWNNTFTIMNYEELAQVYEVFIVYGDNFSYNDRITTDYQGEYEFKYLRPGDYTVYVYSKVNSFEATNGLAPSDEALIQNVTLSKDEELILEEFTVLDN